VYVLLVYTTVSAATRQQVRECRATRMSITYSILRDQSRANAEAVERHAQHAQQRTERAAAADRIRVRYGW
jgi:hypothetical protein